MNAHQNVTADHRRDLPGNIEAEQAVLGAVMVNNAVLGAVMSRVNLMAEHFYEPIHRDIFAGVIDLAAHGKPVNPITLMPYLPKGQMVSGDMSAAQYLARLSMGTVSIAHAPFIAESIVAAHAAREAIYVSDEVANEAYNRWHEAGFIDAIGKLSTRLVSAAESAKAMERQRPGDAYLERYSAGSGASGAVGVAIGLKALQKVLNENVFEAGNLYGLLSSSGEGKTSLTLQIIFHAVTVGHPVLFLSYDQSASQCVAQMVAQNKGISTAQQKSPDRSMSQQERNTAAEFAVWVNSLPFDVIRCQREGNARLLNYARQFVTRYRVKTDKTPLIVIDHIKKIRPRDDRMSPDKIAGEINVEWKSFADEQNCSVLMLNQRNTEGTRRMNPRPIGKDVYGGEGAKEDYDGMIYLYRPAKYKKDLIDTASSDRERGQINAIFAEFGDEDAIKTVAEIGAIKLRFGDPSVRERMQFEARYTRYKCEEDDEERMMF